MYCHIFTKVIYYLKLTTKTMNVNNGAKVIECNLCGNYSSFKDLKVCKRKIVVELFVKMCRKFNSVKVLMYKGKQDKLFCSGGQTHNYQNFIEK